MAKDEVYKIFFTIIPDKQVLYIIQTEGYRRSQEHGDQNRKYI